jgi:hypothetical protein
VYLLVLVLYTYDCRVADKSLARPISRCRRTESIVSLERGVCSCAELQVFFFFVTEAEMKRVTRRASLVAVGCFLAGRAKDLSAPP